MSPSGLAELDSASAPRSGPRLAGHLGLVPSLDARWIFAGWKGNRHALSKVGQSLAWHLRRTSYGIGYIPASHSGRRAGGQARRHSHATLLPLYPPSPPQPFPGLAGAWREARALDSLQSWKGQPRERLPKPGGSGRWEREGETEGNPLPNRVPGCPLSGWAHRRGRDPLPIRLGRFPPRLLEVRPRRKRGPWRSLSLQRSLGNILRVRKVWSL